MGIGIPTSGAFSLYNRALRLSSAGRLLSRPEAI